MTANDDLVEGNHRSEPADDGGLGVPPTTGQKVAIWLVGGYLVLNAAAGLVTLFLLAGRAVPVAADKVALINSLPQLLFFAGFVHIFLTLAGGVFLLMRKRIALPFLAGAAAAKIVSEAFASPPDNVGISPSLYALAVAADVVLLLGTLAFVAWLWRRRVLAP
jgi:hypothetical protein